MNPIRLNWIQVYECVCEVKCAYIVLDPIYMDNEVLSVSIGTRPEGLEIIDLR